MQNLDHSDGSKEDLGQKATDAMGQSQHDYKRVRVCQKASVIAHAEYTVRTS